MLAEDAVVQHNTPAPAPAPARTLNDRFTDLADVVSEQMGRWYITAASFVAVGVWLALGFPMGFSDTWQLSINTPTTVLEMWIGFLLGAASNRNERRMRAMHEKLLAIEEHNAALEEANERLLEQTQALLWLLLGRLPPLAVLAEAEAMADGD